MLHISSPGRRGKMGMLLYLGLMLLTLGACDSQPAASPQGAEVATATASATAAANPPAEVQPTATSAPKPTMAEQPTKLPVGTEKWPTASQTIGGVTYSLRYPQEWKADLSYCPAGSAGAKSSGGLPAGCVVTDFLVGQKAESLGQLSGQALTVDGKQAIKQIDTHPKSGLASRIYTLMMYGDDGKPLFGFSTSIGPGTDPATQDAITTTLDKVVATLTVEK